MMHQSGNVLAFIGDAVLSLQVREHLVFQGITKTKVLQETSVNYVSANAQAAFMEYLLNENLLSEEEMTMYKRGRNAKSASSAKNADILVYRVATGFESLWGYLHLSGNTDRLNELWKLFIERVER